MTTHAIIMSAACLGCGRSLEDVSYRRKLQSEQSKHILPLWMDVFSEILQEGGTTLVNAGGNMCRKCFSAYERCTKQIENLKQSLSTSASVLRERISQLENREVRVVAPAPKRLAVEVASSSASPEVSVIKKYIHSKN